MLVCDDDEQSADSVVSYDEKSDVPHVTDDDDGGHDDDGEHGEHDTHDTHSDRHSGDGDGEHGAHGAHSGDGHDANGTHGGGGGGGHDTPTAGRVTRLSARRVEDAEVGPFAHLQGKTVRHTFLGSGDYDGHVVSASPDEEGCLTGTVRKRHNTKHENK